MAECLPWQVTSQFIASVRQRRPFVFRRALAAAALELDALLVDIAFGTDSVYGAPSSLKANLGNMVFGYVRGLGFVE